MKEPLSIQSRNNNKVKAVASLKESKFRKQSGLFIVEGVHETNVALDYGYDIDSVFFANEKPVSSLTDKIANDVDAFQVSESVFDKLSSRQHPDGILCVFRQKDFPGVSQLRPDGSTILILDGLEKPGNYGAILRSAAAFGIKKVVISGGHLDPYSAQVIRNSRAHSLSFEHYRDGEESIRDWLAGNGYISFVASPKSRDDLQDISFKEVRTAIILGSEHDGVSEFWKEHANRSFSIPMTGKVDSLNVAVSASIVLYEVFKQSTNRTQ